MITAARREKILEILNNRGTVSVTELTKALGASESTIRRDLNALSMSDRLKKVHGGAVKTQREFINTEKTFEDKSGINTGEKRKIAKYAASQINDNDFVYLDAGSSTYLMIDFLKNSKAKFVTNGTMHAMELAQNGCDVMVIGGRMKSSTKAITGIVAAKNLQKYNFSKAFIGTNGISVKQGYTTPDPDEAMLKAVAIEKSFVSYVLADSGKFNKVSAVTFSPLDSSCIICTKCEDEQIKSKTVVKEVV